jgi:hypothetical protein
MLRLLLLTIVVSLLTPAHAAEPVVSQRMVMTWVAPYSIPKSRARLNESFNGVGMKDGLTHLGLQFWVPAKDGGLERAGKHGVITDEIISGFAKWGRTNNVRVLLCVYNGVSGWDWPLARNAFATNAVKFADALVAEVERLNLDGVDMDLEGNGKFDADKPAYLSFMRDLSAKLRAKKKLLTADTFSHIWNAPNQTWWPELFPLVDAINTMGYEEIGAGADKWRAYAAQKAAAGTNAAKLLIGMPGSRDEWQGNKTTEHLNWVLKDGAVGITVWDAELKGATWRTPETWQTIRQIRGGN